MDFESIHLILQLYIIQQNNTIIKKFNKIICKHSIYDLTSTARI